MANLVTLADVKAHANILVTDVSQDVELQGFIDASTLQIEYLTGPINLRSVTEVHRPYGTSRIVLRQPPVYFVMSVIEYVGLTAFTLTEQPPGAPGNNNYAYSMDIPESGILRRISSVGTEIMFFGTAVVVTYQAGTISIPADVRLAALEDIRGLYQQTQLGGRPQFGGGPSQEDGWSAGPMHLFPRLNALLSRSNRTQSIG